MELLRLLPKPNFWWLGAALPSVLVLGASTAHAGADNKVMEPLVVTGTRTPHSLADTPADTSVITRQEIERSPSLTVSDLLGSVPGYNGALLDDALGADSLRATMRGLQLNEGYGLILVDGLRIQGGLGAHGDYGISVNQIPVNMIERIEVVRGASSALYGADALAGVINIITRGVPRERSASAGVSYGVYQMQDKGDEAPEHADRVVKRAYAAYGDRVGERSGFYLHYTRETDEGIDAEPADTGKQYLLGKWHSQLSDVLEAEVGLQYGRARRDAPAATRAGHDRRYDTYRISPSLDWQLEEQSLKLRGSFYKQDFTQGYAGFAHGFRKGDISYYQAEAVHTLYTDHQILTTGVEVLRQSLDYEFRNYPSGGAVEYVSINEDIDTYSAFVQSEIELLDRQLILVPGMRLEAHDGYGTELSPKLSAMYRFTPDTTFRASVGRAFKTPTIRQLYYQGLYRHGEYYIQSNPDLDPETGLNWNLSLEQRLPFGASWLTLGAFRTDVKDKVVRQDSGRTTGDGVPISTYVNVEEARIQGLEVSFRGSWGNGVRLKSGASVTRAENEATGADLPYVPRHTAMLMPSYFHAAWAAGASIRANWVGRQYRSDGNTQPVDSHEVLDLRLWKELGKHARLSLDAKNILDSAKGDDDYAHRIGRAFTLGLDVKF